MSTDLWQAFWDEYAAYEAWDDEDLPNPYQPGDALFRFVQTGRPDVVPLLLTLLGHADRTVRSWGCMALQEVGTSAGAAAGEALGAFVAAGTEPVERAALALEVVDPARLRAIGTLEKEGVIEEVLRFHFGRRDDAKVVEVLEWLKEKGSRGRFQAVLSQWTFRDAFVASRSPVLVQWLRGFLQSSDHGLRSLVSEVLTTANAGESAEDTFLDLVRRKDVSVAAIEKLAGHPMSEVLVPALVEGGRGFTLSLLLRRRRCAGLHTDPAPLRAFLVEQLERPEREEYGDQHAVHGAALCVAELKDAALADSLVVAVNPQNRSLAWEPLVRACRVLREVVLPKLTQELALETDPARKGRLELMRRAVTEPRPSLAHALSAADELFLKGRLETLRGSDAFREYGDVLLEHPSAHAAFQLAWIDRAFGAEIVPSRVDWIRSLGFRDEAFLNQLATPLKEPLVGMRTDFDPGELQESDRERAEKTLAAGLPSLAARWFKDERYEALAREHLARVHAATGFTPPASSPPAAEGSDPRRLPRRAGPPRG